MLYPGGNARLWFWGLAIVGTLFGAFQLYSIVAIGNIADASTAGTNTAVIRTIMRETISDLTKADHFSPHFIFGSFDSIPAHCNLDVANSLGHAVSELDEKVVHIIPAIFGPNFEGPYRAHLCVAKHDHFHTIRLKFKQQKQLHDYSTQPSSGPHCTAMLSVSHMDPDAEHWDWKTTQKPLEIHTYSPEFAISTEGIFLAIYNSNAGQHTDKATNAIDCSMELMIEVIPYKDILKKSSLRGNGQVLLPKDRLDQKQYR